jgi:multicomponent Na+:H+ antiporter subunit D
MAAGTVLYSTGKSKLTELGGLAKKMPVALGFYAVGALSISGMPLFSGYVSKSVITGAIHAEHLDIIVLLLSAATFGTFLHTGLKLPYYTWFGTERKIETSHVPVNQYIGMALTAVPCIAIGVYPPLLLNILPYPVDSHLYSASHVLEVLQLLALAGAAFWLLKGLLKGREQTVLDTDWFYRRPANLAYNLFSVSVHRVFIAAGDIVMSFVRLVGKASTNPPGSLAVAAANISHALSGRGKRVSGLPAYKPDDYRIPLGVMLTVIVIFFVVFLGWIFLTG